MKLTELSIEESKYIEGGGPRDWGEDVGHAVGYGAGAVFGLFMNTVKLATKLLA